MTAPTIKNIKPKPNPFELVPFVNDMNFYQLKMTIRDLWKNIQSLANVFDGRRRDVSAICDKIMDGHKWTKKDIRDRYVYGKHEGFIIRYDSLDNEFTIMDAFWNPIHEKGIPAYSLTEAKAQAKERKAKAQEEFMSQKKEIVVK